LTLLELQFNQSINLLDPFYILMPRRH